MALIEYAFVNVFLRRPYGPDAETAKTDTKQVEEDAGLARKTKKRLKSIYFFSRNHADSEDSDDGHGDVHREFDNDLNTLKNWQFIALW